MSNNEQKSPQTLIEAVRHFSDLDCCHGYMVGIKWPDGQIWCPECGSTEVGEIKTRWLFQCKAKECRKQFSVKVDTIFEDSPLGLDKWLVAVWCIVNAKNGISSCELARAVGVTQKSAWHMLHRIRLAMRTQTYHRITGEVESDESFIGGRMANVHKSKRKNLPHHGNKAVVHGLLQRGGEVRARTVPDDRKATLLPLIRENVMPGSRLYSDIGNTYKRGGLNPEYLHEVVNHAIRYVDGRVHVNGLENFWSLLKRCLRGTYVRVAHQHLDRYLDEQCRRFNLRKGTDASRFHEVMRGIVGKRLRYGELTQAGSFS
ncbi:MAG: IS1595 family transposase [Planctomycetes bacterium]|nr:IS1595 family transposase [Planctomycetota bacterium]